MLSKEQSNELSQRVISVLSRETLSNALKYSYNGWIG